MAQRKSQTVTDEDFPDPAANRETGERSQRLREAVKAAGGNQAVAERARMLVGTLNRYLAGRDMKASAMIALAKACNVSIEWLAIGKGPLRPDEPPAPLPQPPVPELFTTLNMDILADCMQVAVERLTRPGRQLPWRDVARITALLYNEMIEIEAREAASSTPETVNTTDSDLP